MPYGSVYCTYHQLKYSSPNRSKKHKKATQKNLPFGKWRFRENEVRGTGQKQKRIRQKESNRTRQKNNRSDIEKWDQTESPSISDSHNNKIKTHNRLIICRPP